MLEGRTDLIGHISPAYLILVAAHFQKEYPILSDGVFFLERATRKAPKRRLRRMKRGAFEEVSRLSAAVAAVSRLTRR